MLGAAVELGEALLEVDQRTGLGQLIEIMSRERAVAVDGLEEVEVARLKAHGFPFRLGRCEAKPPVETILELHTWWLARKISVVNVRHVQA